MVTSSRNVRRGTTRRRSYLVGWALPTKSGDGATVICGGHCPPYAKARQTSGVVTLLAVGLICIGLVGGPAWAEDIRHGNDDGVRELRVNILTSYDSHPGQDGRPMVRGPHVSLVRPNVEGRGGGKRQPPAQPPAADVATTAVLTSEILSTGFDWRPARVERDGRKTTIHMESWHDNLPRAANIPFQRTHIVSLGKLPAGKHEVVVHIVHYHLGLGPAPASMHHLNFGRVTGRVAFDVAEKAPPATGRVPQITKADFAEFKRLPKDKHRQHVDDPWRPFAGSEALPVVHGLRDSDRGRGLRKLGPTVGTADLATIWKKTPATMTDIPRLRAARSGEPVYLSVLGDPLNLGEHMTLNGVYWTGRKVTVLIDLWRDSGERGKNIIRTPLLFIPLREGAGRTITEPGDYEVEVKWSLLYSPNGFGPGALYTRYSPEAIKDAPVAPGVKANLINLNKNASTTKFTIRAAAAKKLGAASRRDAR